VVIVSVSIDFLPQGKALLDQLLGRTELRQLRQQQTQALPAARPPCLIVLDLPGAVQACGRRG
jgi:hypothetical protein